MDGYGKQTAVQTHVLVVTNQFYKLIYLQSLSLKEQLTEDHSSLQSSG